MTWRPPKGTLAQLVEGAREDCAARKRERPGLMTGVTPRTARGFHRALADRTRSGFPLICEVKRASPSQGTLRDVSDPAALARAYVAGGARCVSVLTEPRRFHGSLDDLRAVRAHVDVPLLRKDFIVDPYMVYEAADAGADCILLIAAGVEPSLLLELSHCARELGLDVLLEVVHEYELDSAERISTPLWGVNARNLETLEVDPQRFGRMAPQIQRPGRLLVAESGVRTAEDLRAFSAQGADAALVGESLMRSEAPEEAVRILTQAKGARP